MWDKQNGPIVRTSYIVANSSGAPSASGQTSIWSLSGALQVTGPTGGVTTLGQSLHTVPVVMAALVSGSVAARFEPGFACRVTGLDLQGVQAPGTSGSATFQLAIQGVSASGGVVTAIAGNLAVGTRTAGTAVTGANTVGTSGEITASVVANLSGAFAAGQGALVFKLAPLT
jgi:hypothetical protein